MNLTTSIIRDDVLTVSGALLDGIPYPVAILDERLEFVHRNSDWDQINRSDPHVESALLSFVTKIGVEALISQVAEIKVGGEHRPVALRRLSSADPARFMATIQPVSGSLDREALLRNRAENAEAVAHKKSSFLASMSHEIRTPLTSILGFASVLSEEVSGTHKEFVNLIEESGRRLLDTLNSVLDLARLESRGLKMRVRAVNMGTEVSNAVELLRPLANAKDVSLGIEVQAKDAYTLLDASALYRVINNIVGNALKFTQSGSVEVVVSADDFSVTIRVQDTGAGIAPEFLPHVFEEFKQEAGEVANRKREGSGLGLAITRRLLDLMGGAISIESEEGVGTEVTITFPRATDEDRENARTDRLDDVPYLTLARGKRILAIEDEEQTTRLIEHILGPYCQVDVVMERDNLFPLLTGDPYDVILLDVNLGSDWSGLEVLKEIRLLPDYARIPIIAVTAFALPGDREQFLEDGFDDYLAKPFTKHLLLSTLENVINQ